ncbi:MAG: prepilin-type N-terminal cleavage/methylation domain-containing protein [Candidatus Margulisiibacteriota bacterium]|nr:prepilin-type N-terminal cleavage/methylation domain-containing protein [Candidatus Margulisiibacteriota bacterium]
MRNRKGFTMVEVLVVVGIIGMLAVFLVPKLMGTQDRAKEGAVKAVMHSVQLGIESYNMENLSYPVAGGITLKDLVDNYLTAGGYMTSVPKNPFTGKEYTDEDVAGKVIYDYNEVKGVYTLKGYKRDGKTEVMELTNL